MEKPINWDDSKNAQLLERYGVGFEEIIIALEQGNLLDDREHQNKEQYSHQKQLVVQIENYAYVVPYIDGKDYWFFKTLFPSRKATSEYLLTTDSHE